MNHRSRPWKALLTLLLLGQLAMIFAAARPGMAATREDVAMFYEELGQFGAWVKYGKYGQVWFPTTVSENWRPYVDGRWVPSNDGWVFETDEPWGWATYHFGNWMPTEEYGWVWVPGGAWYPSTAAWRTSDDYIGWAPVPPPDYEPITTYAPVGGYYPGMPFLDLISPPFWTFVPASRFLLGFGLPFAPVHSFYNCACLAPFNFIPGLFPRTAFLRDFFFFPFPGVANHGFFFFGPSFGFVSRVANIDLIKLNNFARTVNFTAIHRAVPDRSVLARQPNLRQAIPGPVWEGRGPGAQKALNVNLAERNLNRPDVGRPAGRTTVSAAPAPEVIRGLRREQAAPTPEVMHGRGLGLPPQSVQEPRAMQRQMQGLRQSERALPRTARQGLSRQEQLIRRQEAFRPRLAPRPPAMRPQSATPQVQPQGGLPLEHRGGGRR